MFRKYGLLVLALLLCFHGAAMGASVDKVIAVVNDDVVTQLELEARLNRLRAELKAGGAEIPPDEVLRSRMLDRMVMDKLQMQAAERMNITVSEPELDAAVLSVAQNNSLTVRQLRQALADEGIPYNLFRENLKTQIVVSQIINQRIRRRVVVSEDELDDFVARGGGRADAREYDISHILIRIPETASAEDVDQARAKAEKVWDRLREGMKFQEAAATYSDAPDALEGGRLGWKTPGQLPDLFAKELSGVEVGGNTRILQSPNGFHILHINDARGVSSTSVTQTHVRHILMKVDEFLSESEAAQRLDEIRDRILNGEDFAELARIHSDDPVSAAQGGDLGWVMPGELTGPFEAEMNVLEPGEISRPLRSSFGLHLIQVLERRQENMGEEVMRGRARAQLISQKTDEEYEQWLRRLRDEAFVEILDQ